MIIRPSLLSRTRRLKKENCSSWVRLEFLTEDPNQAQVHPIFFDDKITADSQSIVDTWSIYAGKRLSPEDVFGKFTFRVSRYLTAGEPGRCSVGPGLLPQGRR